MTQAQIDAKLKEVQAMDYEQLDKFKNIVSISQISNKAKWIFYEAIDNRRLELNKAINGLAVNGDIDDITGVKDVSN